MTFFPSMVSPRKLLTRKYAIRRYFAYHGGVKNQTEALISMHLLIYSVDIGTFFYHSVIENRDNLLFAND